MGAGFMATSSVSPAVGEAADNVSFDVGFGCSVDSTDSNFETYTTTLINTDIGTLDSADGGPGVGGAGGTYSNFNWNALGGPPVYSGTSRSTNFYALTNTSLGNAAADDPAIASVLIDGTATRPPAPRGSGSGLSIGSFVGV